MANFWIPQQLKGSFDLSFPGFWEGWRAFMNWINGVFWPDGTSKPPHLADSAANNDSIYYSTTASKLVYKDSAGTVHNLY